MARDEARLTDLAEEHARIHAYPCDVSDVAALMTSCDRIDADLGAPNVVIHNAVGGGWGSFDIEPELLERNFQVNVMALLHLSRRTVPAMIEAGGGARRYRQHIRLSGQELLRTLRRRRPLNESSWNRSLATQARRACTPRT